MQKAEELDFGAKARKKIAALPDEEHARIKGLYEVAQDANNPNKEGAKKLLLEIAAKNPKKKGNLIPKIDKPINTNSPTAEAKINCA